MKLYTIGEIYSLSPQEVCNAEKLHPMREDKSLQIPVHVRVDPADLGTFSAPRRALHTGNTQQRCIIGSVLSAEI